LPSILCTVHRLNFQDQLIDKKVIAVYKQVIETCNKILNHANILGFHLMHVPEPNVHSIIVVLEGVIIPLLDKLTMSGDFSPESGIKIADIKQYTLHIREISLSLEQGDREKFNRSVATLQHEPMLYRSRCRNPPASYLCLSTMS